MILSNVHLVGFRNYKDAVINLKQKTLLIGANDVGKTNFLWAIRLLLDRGLSDNDLEPKDSDFFAFEETNEFSITLTFEDVNEDCVVSKLKGKISDDNKLVLAYRAYRDKVTGAKSYKLFAGFNYDSLEEIEDRYYRKVLSIKYISSRRELFNYINREKAYLFQNAKENRSETEAKEDDLLYSELKADLKTIDDKIPRLKYISSATKTINSELSKLSLHHSRQEVVFDAATSDVDDFISNVTIASKSNSKSVQIGGDGRLNQIHLALWASRNELAQGSIKEVAIFCIEEPEVHLHPHQQRKLAEYLNESLKGQVILTSHSPQIAAEFTPNSIIRLLNEKGATRAASKGCSEVIDAAFCDFGFRMSIIPAEAFFSDVVFLVEGPSDELFYKTLSKQIGIDLDKLNISILMVDGVGFSTFVTILNSLEIRWILKTDNDISKIPKKDEYRFAGIQRCINIYRNHFQLDADMEKLLKEEQSFLQGFKSKTPGDVNKKAAAMIRASLEKFNMHLSDDDLENDVFNSALKDDITSYFHDMDEAEIVPSMQLKKATFMYDFIKENRERLSILAESKISQPLIQCRNIIEKL